MGSNVKEMDSSMPSMTDKCHLEVADETLNDQRVIDQIVKLDKTACRSLNSDMISEATMEIIFNPTTQRTDAMFYLRMALKNSVLPTKMRVFLDELKKTHRQHYQEINKVYEEKMKAHKCQKCH